MITVVVVDDHELVRKGICALLQNAPDIKVVGEGSDGQDAIDILPLLKPEVVIMDISMPRLDGVQALERIDIHHTAAVMLSMHEDDVLIRRVFQMGAKGYVLKRAVSEDLLEAVRAASRGERFMSASISATDIDEFIDEDAETVFDLLTPREREILQLIAEGQTTKQIANTLSLSIKTIEKHRGNCMSKLNVRSLASLVRVAIQKKLIILEEDQHPIR